MKTLAYMSGDRQNQALAETDSWRMELDHEIVNSSKELKRAAVGADVIVIDFDHVDFGEHSDVLQIAEWSLRRRQRVIIHTYYPEDPRLPTIIAQGAILAKNAPAALRLMRRLLQTSPQTAPINLPAAA